MVTAAAPALSSLAKSAGLGTTTTASAPPLQSFTSLLSAAIAPLFPAMTWINTACPQSPAYLHIPGLQSFLGPNGTSATSSTGDPYVDWVDSIVNNNGQPLAIGSAPLYGSNYNETAFSALDKGIDLSIQMVVQSTGNFGAGFGLALSLNEYLETGDPTNLILSVVGIVGGMAVRLNPCSIVSKGYFAYGAASSALSIAANPTDPFVGFHIMGLVGSVAGLAGAYGSCFTGDMLVDVEGGKKRAEEIVEGDRIWSRHEDEPDGPLSLKEVEEVFVRVSPVLNVYVAGQVLRTTGEHPFWVENKRTWLAARDMSAGDWLRTRDGALVTVEGIEACGVVETVYNWRVSDYHTYYVSATVEGVSLWAHNAGGRYGGKSPKKPTGSYTITFQSGMQYHGKGPQTRAGSSAKREAAVNKDPAVSVQWKSAKDTVAAFKAEARRIRKAGGIGGNNYNRINSPGEKLL